MFRNLSKFSIILLSYYSLCGMIGGAIFWTLRFVNLYEFSAVTVEH